MSKYNDYDRNFLSYDDVMKAIAKMDIVLIGKSYCRYTRQAKQILSQFRFKSTTYLEIDLDIKCSPETTTRVQQRLETLTGLRTVPQLFFHSSFIGDSARICSLDKIGKLESILFSFNDKN